MPQLVDGQVVTSRDLHVNANLCSSSLYPRLCSVDESCDDSDDSFNSDDWYSKDSGETGDLADEAKKIKIKVHLNPIHLADTCKIDLSNHLPKIVYSKDTCSDGEKAATDNDSDTADDSADAVSKQNSATANGHADCRNKTKLTEVAKVTAGNAPGKNQQQEHIAVSLQERSGKDTSQTVETDGKQQAAAAEHSNEEKKHRSKSNVKTSKHKQYKETSGKKTHKNKLPEHEKNSTEIDSDASSKGDSSCHKCSRISTDNELGHISELPTRAHTQHRTDHRDHSKNRSTESSESEGDSEGYESKTIQSKGKKTPVSQCTVNSRETSSPIGHAMDKDLVSTKKDKCVISQLDKRLPRPSDMEMVRRVAGKKQETLPGTDVHSYGNRPDSPESTRSIKTSCDTRRQYERGAQHSKCNREHTPVHVPATEGSSGAGYVRNSTTEDGSSGAGYVRNSTTEDAYHESEDIRSVVIVSRADGRVKERPREKVSDGVDECDHQIRLRPMGLSPATVSRRHTSRLDGRTDRDNTVVRRSRRWHATVNHLKPLSGYVEDCLYKQRNYTQQRWTNDIMKFQLRKVLKDMDRMYMGKDVRSVRVVTPVRHLSVLSLPTELEASYIESPFVRTLHLQALREWMAKKPLDMLLLGKGEPLREPVCSLPVISQTDDTVTGCSIEFFDDIFHLLRGGRCGSNDMHDLYPEPSSSTQETVHQVFRQVRNYMEFVAQKQSSGVRQTSPKKSRVSNSRNDRLTHRSRDVDRETRDVGECGDGPDCMWEIPLESECQYLREDPRKKGKRLRLKSVDDNVSGILDEFYGDIDELLDANFLSDLCQRRSGRKLVTNRLPKCPQITKHLMKMLMAMNRDKRSSAPRSTTEAPLNGVVEKDAREAGTESVLYSPTQPTEFDDSDLIQPDVESNAKMTKRKTRVGTDDGKCKKRKTSATSGEEPRIRVERRSVTVGKRRRSDSLSEQVIQMNTAESTARENTPRTDRKRNAINDAHGKSESVFGHRKRTDGARRNSAEGVTAACRIAPAKDDTHISQMRRFMRQLQSRRTCFLDSYLSSSGDALGHTPVPNFESSFDQTCSPHDANVNPYVLTGPMLQYFLDPHESRLTSHLGKFCPSPAEFTSENLEPENSFMWSLALNNVKPKVASPERSQVISQGAMNDNTRVTVEKHDTHEPAVNDHISSEPTEEDKRSHEQTVEDQVSQVPTAEDQDSHVPTAEDQESHLPTSKNQDSNMPTAEQHDSHAPTATEENGHVPTLEDQDSHVPIAECHNSHVQIVEDHNSHVPTAELHDSHVPKPEDHDSYLPTVEDHELAVEGQTPAQGQAPADNVTDLAATLLSYQGTSPSKKSAPAKQGNRLMQAFRQAVEAKKRAKTNTKTTARVLLKHDPEKRPPPKAAVTLFKPPIAFTLNQKPPRVAPRMTNEALVAVVEAPQPTRKSYEDKFVVSLPDVAQVNCVAQQFFSSVSHQLDGELGHDYDDVDVCGFVRQEPRVLHHGLTMRHLSSLSATTKRIYRNNRSHVSRFSSPVTGLAVPEATSGQDTSEEDALSTIYTTPAVLTQYSRVTRAGSGQRPTPSPVNGSSGSKKKLKCETPKKDKTVTLWFDVTEDHDQPSDEPELTDEEAVNKRSMYPREIIGSDEDSSSRAALLRLQKLGKSTSAGTPTDIPILPEKMTPDSQNECAAVTPATAVTKSSIDTVNTDALTQMPDTLQAAKENEAEPAVSRSADKVSGDEQPTNAYGSPVKRTGEHGGTGEKLTPTRNKLLLAFRQAVAAKNKLSPDITVKAQAKEQHKQPSDSETTGEPTKKKVIFAVSSTARSSGGSVIGGVQGVQQEEDEAKGLFPKHVPTGGEVVVGVDCGGASEADDNMDVCESDDDDSDSSDSLTECVANAVVVSQWPLPPAEVDTSTAGVANGQTISEWPSATGHVLDTIPMPSCDGQPSYAVSNIPTLPPVPPTEPSGVPAPVPAPIGVPAPVPAPSGVPAPVPAPVGVPAPVPAPAPSGVPAPVPAPIGVPAPVPAPIGVPVPVPAPCGVPAPLPAPCGVPAPVSSPIGVPAPVPAPSGVPAHVSASFGVPAHVSASFGVPAPVPAPSGVPAHVSASFGVPAHVSASFGVPAHVSASFGVPAPVPAPSGVPAYVSASFGVPAPVHAPFGVPAREPTPCGVPAPVHAPFGVPAREPTPCGVPAPVHAPFGVPVHEPTPSVPAVTPAAPALPPVTSTEPAPRLVPTYLPIRPSVTPPLPPVAAVAPCAPPVPSVPSSLPTVPSAAPPLPPIPSEAPSLPPIPTATPPLTPEDDPPVTPSHPAASSLTVPPLPAPPLPPFHIITPPHSTGYQLPPVPGSAPPLPPNRATPPPPDPSTAPPLPPPPDPNAATSPTEKLPWMTGEPSALDQQHLQAMSLFLQQRGLTAPIDGPHGEADPSAYAAFFQYPPSSYDVSDPYAYWCQYYAHVNPYMWGWGQWGAYWSQWQQQAEGGGYHGAWPTPPYSQPWAQQQPPPSTHPGQAGGSTRRFLLPTPDTSHPPPWGDAPPNPHTPSPVAPVPRGGDAEKTRAADARKPVLVNKTRMYVLNRDRLVCKSIEVSALRIIT